LALTKGGGEETLVLERLSFFRGEAGGEAFLRKRRTSPPPTRAVKEGGKWASLCGKTRLSPSVPEKEKTIRGGGREQIRPFSFQRGKSLFLRI